MKKLGYLLMVLAVFSLASCRTVDEGKIGREKTKERQAKEKKAEELKMKKLKAKAGKKKEYVLKGTNSEIMAAFKKILSRHELEEFSEGKLKIVTKARKLDESSPHYEANKQESDIYDQYVITLKRKEYDVIVNIRYLILTQKMDMKTNKIGLVKVNRIKEVEDDLINKVKRLLYGT
jgi:hypothetical protein